MVTIGRIAFTIGAAWAVAGCSKSDFNGGKAKQEPPSQPVTSGNSMDGGNRPRGAEARAVTGVDDTGTPLKSASGGPLEIVDASGKPHPNLEVGPEGTIEGFTGQDGASMDIRSPSGGKAKLVDASGKPVTDPSRANGPVRVLDENAKPIHAVVLKPGLPRTPVTENFQGPVAEKVDVVWVLDNSNSMQPDLDKVKANTVKFVDAAQSSLDANIVFLSLDKALASTLAEPQLKARVDVAELLPGRTKVTQVPVFVQSTNLLAMAASAVCDPSATSASPGAESVCGVPRSEFGSCQDPDTFVHTGNGAQKPIPDARCIPSLSEQEKAHYIEGLPNVASIAGKARAFLRPDARKLFVFVTDDDATGFLPNHFLSAMGRAYPGVKVQAFAFANTDTSCLTQGISGNISQVGSHYQTLAASTGARVFQKCPIDWADHFTSLTSATLQTSFPLKTPGLRVKKVLVAGKEVPQSAYRVSAGVLEILDATLLGKNGRKVEVHGVVP